MTGRNDSGLVGTSLGKYRIERELSANERHSVLEVIDVLDERLLIMKVAPSHHKASLGAEASYLREIGNHPHVMGLIDERLDGTVPYIILEYAGDETVRTLMQRDGKVPYGRWIQIVKQAFQGLSHIHNKGIIHGDIKPENILMDENLYVRIGDFDLAQKIGESSKAGANLEHLVDDNASDVPHISDSWNVGSDSSSFSGSRIVAGTYAYMAPEQERGNPTPQSDIYSLGVVAYEMLMGRLPQRHFPDMPSSEGAPAWVDNFIYKTIDGSPSKRFQTAKEALKFVEQNLEERTRGQAKSNNFEDRVSQIFPYNLDRMSDEKMLAAVFGVVSGSLLGLINSTSFTSTYDISPLMVFGFMGGLIGYVVAPRGK